MKGQKCGVSRVFFGLVIIGALNWGLVGLGNYFDGNWNLVHLIFGGWSWLENVIYIVVGVCGVLSLFSCKCKTCKDDVKGAAKM